MSAAAEAVHPSRHGHSAQSEWNGALQLRFAHRADRTVVAHRRHEGPMMVQSAFYPEGRPCHVYLLHPPGGIVGGDRLQLDVGLDAHAHALLTTPAAGKFYRSRAPGEHGPRGEIVQNLDVGDAAVLEWLPCESIVFDGANCDARTRINLQRTSKLLAWEGWVFGRPACDEAFSHGSFTQHFDLHIDGRPVLIERNHTHGGSAWMKQPWGLGGRIAMATLVAFPGGEHALGVARAACLDGPADAAGRRTLLAACTELDGALVCRVMSTSLPALRAQLERWWRVLRPGVIGCEAVPPRIWAT